MPYTDVSENPCWADHVYDDAAFRAANPNAAELLAVPCVGPWTLGCDTMHNKHLGMDMYYGASVLYLLIFVMLEGL